MNWFPFLFLTFALSWAGVGLYRWYAVEKGMLDQPNARSSHIAPTPRGGGFIFFMGWLVLACVLKYFHIISTQYLILFSPVILVGAIGFWDDHKNLSATTRLIVQFIAAGSSLFIIGEGGYLVQPWLSSVPLPLCFLVIMIAMVWMINLFNFMDGSDGIAASEGIFVFAVGGYILFHYHAYEMATLAWGLAALLAGFLTWNWPIARIFMGDSGSCFLGFMVALYALISYKLFNVPLMIWVLLTGLFWFDATITLVRRILAGEQWREPHKKHAYQRLIQSGWSHQQVLLATFGMNAILSFLAYLVSQDPRLTYFAFALAILLLFCAYILVEIAKPMYKKWHDDATTTSDM